MSGMTITGMVESKPGGTLPGGDGSGKNPGKTQGGSGGQTRNRLGQGKTLPEPTTGSSAINRLPVYLRLDPGRFDAPLQLRAKAGVAAESPSARQGEKIAKSVYQKSYADAAQKARALADRLSREAQTIANLAAVQNNSLGQFHQSSLDKQLGKLEGDLARQRIMLRRNKRQSLRRLHTTARSIEQGLADAARDALSEMSGLHAKYVEEKSGPLATATAARAEIKANPAAVKKAQESADKKLDQLKKNPASEFPNRGSTITRAENEAIRDFIPPYVEDAKTDIKGRGKRFQDDLAKAYECVPCNLDSAFQAIDAKLESLSVTGPEKVRKETKAKTDSLTAKVEQLENTIRQTYRQSEKTLIEQHETVREQLVNSAEQQGAAERARIASGAQVQSDQLSAMAGAQSTAVENVHDMFEQQSGGDEQQFAQAVAGGSQKLAKNLDGLGRKQPGDASKKYQETAQETGIQSRLFEDQQRETRQASHKAARKLIRKARGQLNRRVKKEIDALKPLPNQARAASKAYLTPLYSAFKETSKNLKTGVANTAKGVKSAYEGGGGSADTGKPDSLKDTGKSGGTGAGKGGAAGKPLEKGKAPARPASCSDCGKDSKKDKKAPEGNSGTKSAGGGKGGGKGKEAAKGTAANTPATFVDYCKKVAGSGREAEQIKGLETKARASVEPELQKRASAAVSSFETFTSVDITKLMGALRSITAIQGTAIKELYKKDRPRGIDFDISYMIRRKSWSAGSTDRANIKAAQAALNGNVPGAAMAELTAAFNYSNNNQRIREVMESLTPQQMIAFNEKYGSKLDELQKQLDGRELKEFMALRNVKEGGADVASALNLKYELDKHNRKQGTKRGFAKGEAVKKASLNAYDRAIHGDKERKGPADIFKLEHDTTKTNRAKQHWKDTRLEFAKLDGVVEASSKDSKGNLTDKDKLSQANKALSDYATRDYDPYAHRRPKTKTRSGRPRYNFYEDKMKGHHKLWIDNILEHGGDSEEARAAEFVTKLDQKGKKTKPKDLEKIIRTGEGDAKEGAGYNQLGREKGRAEELKKRKKIMLLAAQYKAKLNPDTAQPKNDKAALESVQKEVKKYYGKDAKSAELMLGVINEDGTPGQRQKHALTAIENAISSEDHEHALAQLKRMDRKEIDKLAEDYHAEHGKDPSLYQKLGLFKGNHWSITNMNGAVFSGDEANSLEIAMMGVPQHDKERAEVALRVMDQTEEQSSWLGRGLAGREFDRMTENAAELRRLAGIKKGDIDELGRIRTKDPLLGTEIRLGNFDKDGNFNPPIGADVSDFETAVAMARITSSNYTEATDKIANFVTTALVVVAAVVTTALTGGAAASIWLPLLVTAGAGLVGIGLNAAIKGGRYSKDQVTRDLAMTIVQAATAGVGAAAGIYLRGGAAALGTTAKSLSVAEKSLGTLKKLSLVKEMALGAGTGFMGGVGGALADPVAWRKGTVGGNALDGGIKGLFGGAIGAAAMRPVARMMNSTSLSTRAMGRSLGTGLGSAGGKAFELGYDTADGKYKGSLGDAFGEISMAGLQGAAQGFAEAGAEHFGDRGGSKGRGLAAKFRRKGDNIDDPFAQTTKKPAGAGEVDGAGRPRPEGSWDDASGETASSRRDATDNSSGDAPRDRNKIAANDDLGAAAPRRDIGDDSALAARQSRDLLDLSADSPMLRMASDGGDSSVPRKPIVGTNLEGAPNPHGKLRKIIADNDNAPVRAIIALDNSDPLRLPEGSVIIHPESKNLLAANDNYFKAVSSGVGALDKAGRPMVEREVGLFFNPETGDYAVIQGGPAHVGSFGAPWQTVRHFHPRHKSLDFTNPKHELAQRIPTGADGDFDLIISEARAGKLDEHASTIDYIDKDGEWRQTGFSVERDGDGFKFHVEADRPKTGEPFGETFDSLDDYHDWANKFTGFDYSQSSGTGSPPLKMHTGIDRRVGGNAPDHKVKLTSDNRSDINAIHDIFNDAGGPEIISTLLDLQMRGDFDPAKRPAADMSAAHDLVDGLGLVGKPDSMIRLSNILSDQGGNGAPALSPETKALIADATLSATREMLQKQGKLSPDEPLLMLFQGAPDKQIESYSKYGIDLGLTKGSPGGDDVGLALYGSLDPQSAGLYIEGTGTILPAVARPGDLGNILDIRSGAELHQKFAKFVNDNQSGYGTARIRPDATPADIASGDPMRFLFYEKAYRQAMFEKFLKTLSPDQQRPDIVFANLGDAVTSGTHRRTKDGGNIRTNQFGIRVNSDGGQAIADLFNRQHGFKAKGTSTPEPSGPVARMATGKKATSTGIGNEPLSDGGSVKAPLRAGSDDIDALADKSFDRMFNKDDDQSGMPDTAETTTQIRKAVDDAIGEFLAQPSEDSAALGKLISVAPDEVRNIVHNAASRQHQPGDKDEQKLSISDRQTTELRTALVAKGLDNAEIEAHVNALSRIASAESPLSRSIAKAAEKAIWTKYVTAAGDGDQVEAAIARKVTEEGIKKFSNKTTPGSPGPEMKMLLKIDKEAARKKKTSPAHVDAERLVEKVVKNQQSIIKPILSETASARRLAEDRGLTILKADSLSEGKANAPGLDFVGIRPGPADGAPLKTVEVVIADDKAVNPHDGKLNDVPAMTGTGLPKNLKKAATEIEARIEQQKQQQIEPSPAELAAIEQMRSAAIELDALHKDRNISKTTATDEKGLKREQRRKYAEKVSKILKKHNISMLITSERGTITELADWLKNYGFALEID